MATANDLVRETSTLISLPEIYLRVKQILDDPKAGMTNVAEVISRDPGLCARMLKIANSAFYGFPSAVETVTQAANLMGAEKVHNLVLSTTVTRAFSRISEKQANMDTFWQNSIYRAVLSRLLARRYLQHDSERTFVQGLLSEVGQLIMYQAVPELSQSALLHYQQEGGALHSVQQRLIGCDYAQVGGELLRFWELPERLSAVVYHQFQPWDAGEHRAEASIVHLAGQIAQAADPDTPLIERQCNCDWERLQFQSMEQDALAELGKEADKGAQEALALIFPGHSMAA